MGGGDLNGTLSRTTPPQSVLAPFAGSFQSGFFDSIATPSEPRGAPGFMATQIPESWLFLVISQAPLASGRPQASRLLTMKPVAVNASVFTRRVDPSGRT